MFLEAGADVNAESLDGSTPLHVALAGNVNGRRLGIARLLVKAGADLTAKDKIPRPYGPNTPLDLAHYPHFLYADRAEIVSLLDAVTEPAAARRAAWALWVITTYAEKISTLRRAHQDALAPAQQGKLDAFIESLKPPGAAPSSSASASMASAPGAPDGLGHFD